MITIYNRPAVDDNDSLSCVVDDDLHVRSVGRADIQAAGKFFGKSMTPVHGQDVRLVGKSAFERGGGRGAGGGNELLDVNVTNRGMKKKADVGYVDCRKDGGVEEEGSKRRVELIENELKNISNVKLDDVQALMIVGSPRKGNAVSTVVVNDATRESTMNK